MMRTAKEFRALLLIDTDLSALRLQEDGMRARTRVIEDLPHVHDRILFVRAFVDAHGGRLALQALGDLMTERWGGKYL